MRRWELTGLEYIENDTSEITLDGGDREDGILRFGKR